jgi:hypothetical protein
MTKEEYLKNYIYKGLTNLNNGFDSPSIYYFDEFEFKIVLNRVEKLGLGIFGIEPWGFLDKHYFDTKVYEEYSSSSTDTDWFNKAFKEFCSINEKLMYSASYYIPEELLKDK